jgi:hypothetical protein
MLDFICSKLADERPSAPLPAALNLCRLRQAFFAPWKLSFMKLPRSAARKKKSA